ncbi:hypothetical protein KIPB_014505, partial [Kipferlia bialata]|eukprot:g14505.t1
MTRGPTLGGRLLSCILACVLLCSLVPGVCAKPDFKQLFASIDQTLSASAGLDISDVRVARFKQYLGEDAGVFSVGASRGLASVSAHVE